MSILAVGGEPDSVQLAEGSFVFDTTAGHFDANASRGGLQCRGGTNSYYFLFGNNSEVWLHAQCYQAGHGAGTVFYFYNEGGGNAYAITEDSDGKWQAQKYVSGFTNLGSLTAAAVLDGDKHDIDIHILVDDTVGVFEVYKDGIAVISFTGDTSQDSTFVGQMHPYGVAGGSHDLTVSQLIAADESTIDMVVATVAPSGSGASSEWTGAYSDVDEVGYDIGDNISTPDADQVETFAATNINAAFSSYEVKAFGIAMRGKISPDSAVTDVEAAIRISSTDYFSSDLDFNNDGDEHSIQNVWDVSPATSTAFTQAEVNGLEIGVKSKA